MARKHAPRFFSFLLLLAMGLAPALARADLRVVATVPSLAAIAREIGGSHATVSSLALPTQDPHVVDAKPSLALDLARADLLVAVGLDLEVGWLPTLQSGARNAKIARGGAGYLEVASFVRLLDVLATVDRSQGDIHPGGSPHFLYDPRAAASIARGLAARMGELDPPNKVAYEASAASFATRLDAARRAWEARLAPARGAPIIGYHKTWTYLADWLGLRQVELLEPKPGVPPNPAHVARVVVTGRKEGVRIILEEAFYPDSTTKLVAEKIGAKVVTMPGGADFEAGQSYFEHLDAALKRLEQGLAP
jgi:zinc/manganese transport system substrate-binding protein